VYLRFAIQVAATSPQNSHFAAKRRNCIGQKVLKSGPAESKCFGISEPIFMTVGYKPNDPFLTGQALA